MKQKNSAALSTLQPSDDKVESNSADGDGSVHNQRLWDATKTLARDIEPHRGCLQPTGSGRHGGGALSSAVSHQCFNVTLFEIKLLNRIFSTKCHLRNALVYRSHR